ncbi:MAG: hypothetical protein HY243_14920 [Proteobacteria bacterium]|nr:hypothetical protein [Pseudomonadota bacterium]
MGAARLLAKAWVAFCLFAGAHAVVAAIHGGIPVSQALLQIGLCIVLFVPMGLLFVGGFGFAGGIGKLSRLQPIHFAPGFNEIVFMIFVVASFAMQISFAPEKELGGVLGALQAALHFVVPAQRSLETALAACPIEGGGIVFASAFAWLLALIYLGSALSRIRLAAGIVRLERKVRPEMFGETPLAAVLGLLAVVAIQLLFFGTAYSLLPCGVFPTVIGSVMIGLAPLMFSYLVVAAITNILALGPED